MTHAAVLSPALWKEIRALLPLWAASIAAVVGAFVWQQGHSLDLALFAYVTGSLAIGAQAVGQEYAYRTLPVLLSQPADRRRVYLLKFLVLTLMLIEFALLTLIGGTVGVLGGTLVYRFVNMTEVTQGFLVNFGLYPNPIIACVIASLGVGLLAGGWPAMRSANMSVVDGLRRVV